MVVAGSSSPVSSVDGPVCDRRLASTGHGGGFVVIGQSAIKMEGRREVGLKKATNSMVARFFLVIRGEGEREREREFLLFFIFLVRK